MREKHREENAYHLNFVSSSNWNISSLFAERNCHNCSEGWRGWRIYERIFYHDKRIIPATGRGVGENTMFQMEYSIRGNKRHGVHANRHSQSATCRMFPLGTTRDQSFRMDNQRNRETVHIHRNSPADSDGLFPLVSSRLIKSMKLR
jgi:hypothetical protein